MKRHSSLRQGMQRLRRGLLQAFQEAGAGRTSRIDAAVRKNIVVAHTDGRPGSQVHASSAQYAPIVQRGRGSHSRTTGKESEDHS